MRKLIYYVACSQDGFIAREDGALEDFTAGGEHFADLLAEFPETIPGHLQSKLEVAREKKHFDSVLMGRATYAVGQAFGVTSPYPHLAQYVVSGSMNTSPDPAVTLIQSDPAGHVRRLKNEPGLDIWLCGGGKLAASLLGEIDEFILKMNPFLMGSGLPMIAGQIHQDLRLLNHRVYSNGFSLMHFTCDRAPPGDRK